MSTCICDEHRRKHSDLVAFHIYITGLQHNFRTAVSTIMQIQSPFQITWEKLQTANFVDYFFRKFAKYGDGVALVS